MQFPWRQKRLSLTTKFIFLTSSLVVITAVIITLFITFREFRHIHNELLEHGKSLGTMVAQSSEYGIYTENKAALKQIANSIFTDPDIVYIAFLRETKTPLMQKVNAPLVDIPLSLRNKIKEQSSQISHEEFHNRADGHDYIDFIAPVISMAPKDSIGGLLYDERSMKQKVVGYVQYGLSQRKIHGQVDEFLYSTLVFTILFVGLSIVFTIILTRKITSPLETLGRVTHDIAQGEFDHHIDIRTNDELSDLSDAFNNMLGHLRSYRNKVAENTSELYDANLQMMEEINERKHAEEELLQAQRRLEQLLTSARAEKEFSDAIFNFAVSGIVVLDREGFVLKINRAGAEILQVDMTAIIGQRITDIYPATSDMLLIKPELGREVAISLPNETVIPLGFSNSHLLDPSTGKEAIIILFRNMTEIRLLQAELRKKEYFEAIGKVVAGVAHEIRNPLLGISSIADILSREVSSPQHQALIETVTKETDRMKHLIEDLLLYTGPSSLVMEEIDMGAVLNEVIRYAQGRRHDIDIAVNASPLPVIRADRDKLIHVFRNVLNNGLDAARKAIKISARATSGIVEVRVTDDGEGIAGRDLDMIFDPFFSTKRGGSGLGLSISKKIIEDHGGSIKVSSIEGKGTAVTIMLKV